MAEADSEKYPSIPSNYVSIAQLQERWLKEKQKQQEEKEKQETPLHQDHSKNLQKGENCSEKCWREVGLTIAKEPKLKEVKKRGYFGKRKNQEMAKVSTFNVAKVETVVSVENGDKELSKGKYHLNRENKEEVKEGSMPIIYRVLNHLSSGSGNSWLSKYKQVGVSNGRPLASRLSKDMEVKEGVVSIRGPLASGFSQLSKDKEVKGGKSIIHRVSNCMPSASGISQLSKDKEVKEMGSVCMVEDVENKVGRKLAGQRSRVGFRGKKDSRRMKEIVEQSRQEHNVEKEEVSVNVKERSNEKGRVRGAFLRYGDKRTDVRGNALNIGMAEEEIMTVESVDGGGKELKYQLKSENKEIKEMCNVDMVEVVGENKVDKEIPIQRSRIGFSVKKDNRRMMGIKVGEVGDQADGVEQSQQENNVEEKVVSDNVKVMTNEKVTVRGENGDKRGDVTLVDPEANMKIDSNFGNLSLSDRRYGYERSSDRAYGDKWRYGSSRRYEPRRMPKRRDCSFVWVKKGESSTGDVAEIETQVDSSSQSTSQSQLCSQ